jgi:protein-S-isoprenylcysteine O-methyltransferase Ste14
MSKQNEFLGILSLIILLGCGYLILFYLPDLLVKIYPHFRVKPCYIVRLIGYSLMGFSIILWILSVILLRIKGKGTPHPCIETTKILVKNSTYQFLRHPIYFALLLFVFALGLVKGNLLYFCYVLYITVILLNIIIPQEENTLSDKFPEYSIYKMQVSCLFPFFKNKNIKGVYWLIFVILLSFLLQITTIQLNIMITQKDLFIYVLKIISYGLLACGSFSFIYSVILHLIKKCRGLKNKGIYRFSRNPMYLGIFVLYIGISLFNNNLLSLLLFGVVYGFAYYYVVYVKEVRQKDIYKQEFVNHVAKRKRFI